MKKLFSVLSLALLFLITVNLKAQVSTYVFSESSGAYTPITGTLLDSTTGSSGATSLDDVQYLNVPIGFSFVFNGIGYSTFNMNTNFQMTFGATGPGTTNYTPISSTTAYVGCIAPVTRDMQGGFLFNATATLASTTLSGVTNFDGIVVGRLLIGTGIAAGTRVTGFNIGLGEVYMDLAATSTSTSTKTCASGNIRYSTTGSAGSRIFTLQYTNFKRYGTTGLHDNFNIQIKLYEATGVAEVVYGTFKIANATLSTTQVGLRGATNADFNNRSTTTNWNATVAGGTNASTCDISSTVFPSSGKIFRWSPPPPPANDVGVTVNNAPSGAYFVGDPAVFPSVKIKNYGTSNQTTPFYTIYKITGPVAYADSTADTLASGFEKSVTMPSSFAFTTAGTYNVTAYTNLPTDSKRINDTLKTTFSVAVILANYGQDSGYFYANNLATNQPSYPKWGWKDTLGSKSIILNSAAQPGYTLVGSLDDGYFKLSLKDILMQYNIDTTGKRIKLNGVGYDSLFVNTNGIIGMTEAYGTYSFNDFNIDGAQVPHNAILAFWHDINFGQITGGSNRLSYKAVGNQLIITYDRAVSFAPTTDWVTFQVVLQIVNTAGANSNWRVTFADETNNNTSASFIDNYLARLAANPPAATVFRNYVMGWTSLGASAYSGYVSSGNPFPASPITEINVNRLIYNTNRKGLAVEFGPNQNSLNVHDVQILCVGLSLQGLQSNGRVRDTVQVVIRNATAPYQIIQSNKVFLDSARNTINNYSFGRKYIDVSVLKKGQPYYISIRHRNSIRVFSNSTSSLNDTLKYDFTTGIGQTYGSNAVLVNGAASIYTGDVNGDAVIDLADVAQIDNDIFNFVSGPYDITDLNWDGVVDVGDATFADNNAFNFIGEVTPPGVSVSNEIKEINYNYKAPTELIILPDPNAVPKIDNSQPDNSNVKKED
ncbi:MAG: hypothetical protein JSS91_11680 [Bacteroidetes bacterium]|nr:hypothetical protein [Bacteroidota bacterium]